MERLPAWRSPAPVLAVVAAAIVLAPTATAQTPDPPRLESSPYYGLVWDFVPSGTESDVQYATLSNPSPTPNTVQKVELAGRDPGDCTIAADECTGQSLAAGATCRVGVRFTPKHVGTRVAELKVSDSTPCPRWIRLAGSSTTPKAMPRARAAACSTSTTTTNVTNVTNVVANSESSLQPAPRDVVAFPSTCTSRRVIRIRVFAPRGTRLKSVRAMLGNKPVKVRKVDGRFRATIDLRGRRQGVSVVRLWLRTTDGRKFFGKRVYRTCGKNGAVGTPRY